ncbi:MAG: hypothetical protein EPO00_02025, partial [Chloroflexota bacterium]
MVGVAGPMRRRIPNLAILVVAVALAGIAGGVALSACAPVPIPSPPPSFATVSPTRSPTLPPTEAPTVVPTPIDVGPPSSRVTAFYYGWYGTPSIDGRWRHWAQGGHTPPEDLGAAFEPALGPYSSHDPIVLGRHMQELLAARVGTIAVSWWGPGSFDDLGLPAIVEAAGSAGIGVALHIEPYKGRTAASIGRDIRAFVERYGDSPGIARAARATKFGTSVAPRPVVYVYLPREVDEAGLRHAIDELRG